MMAANEHERRKLEVPQQVETDRLLIRILHAGDGEAVYQALMESMERLSPWFHWVQDTPTLESNELYVREAQVMYYNRSKLEFGIFLKEDNTLIGRIGIHAVSWDPIVRELGYWLRTGYEGHGYMHEAVQALLAVCFEKLQAHKVVIRAESDNQRSLNVARRAGFTYEGTACHYQPSNADNTRMADLCFFSLLRCEWEKEKAG
ncbi:MAG: GNAT family N-acetyltransferase [Anaerolineae bacterium]|jgi:RimJ/RimL family protein N-acetyltransferase|nr:GNAT family N-acetyltransferase [Anaerolineae bacterium]